ncbi:RICIN domain-containing protein [Dactylosporangium darangshiense]|uniref:Ricin B lectin domain-containing protein n=1 Tax=Dactylosporangium darangshiense TaxID=579108 RepID=A0ABP8DA33_9ACTN
MTPRRLGTALVTLAAATTLLSAPASAYTPTGGVIYQLPDTQACLKGRGNCAIYPKAAQLPGGRLVASFEKATVVAATGGATGETLPVYKSDDNGATWQALSEVKAPAYLASDPQVAKYTSNWTNPYLYVLPQAVGNLAAGTLLLASIVSGEDAYYTEHKAADPNWTPSNDGDRRDLALALYSSTDQGATWAFRNIIATGGWQGGSAGAPGANVAAANTYRQVDPVWEPYLMVYNGQLVAYYSDENEYTGYNAQTGIPALDPANTTAADPISQVLVHRTWNGTSAAWSAPVIDVSGLTGQTLGGGRPGMANVVPTADGKWMLTYENWGGGGDNVRYKISTSPLNFWSVGGNTGTGVTSLPVAAGSHGLATGGSPVLVRLTDGRLVYNAAGSGNVWVNASGRSDGVWTEFQTTAPGAYSRNLTYVQGTGRIAVLANRGVSTIVYAEVDLGNSAGPYHRIVNRKTGQVIGTGGHVNDANLGNADVPDVALEAAGAATNADTQYWRVIGKPDGGVTLLNKSGGRAAAIWGGNATAGQRIGQWVDNTAAGLWRLVTTADGYLRFMSAANPAVYLTGASAGAPLTLQNAATDGSQDWQLVGFDGSAGLSTPLVGAASGRCLDVLYGTTANGTQPGVWDCNGGANQRWNLNGQTLRALGKCLDAPTGATAGTKVQIWDCNGGTNQRWNLNANGTVSSVSSGLCLDVNANLTANGSAVILWTCTGAANQRWTPA